VKGTRIRFTAQERAWVKANCTLVIGELHRAFVVAFDRHDVNATNLNALRKRNGWRTGRTGHFAAGATPPNKGKKMPFNPNSAATQFKKGQTPHNTKHVGHERVRASDRYIEISVAETNPHTGFERRYVLKHKHLWEQRNGPVPKGMALKCLDGDRQNTSPENWEAVPRGLLPRLNGKSGRNYDDAAPEIKPTIMAIAKLEHRVRSSKALDDQGGNAK
jgi:hypothetical protein